MPKVRAEQRLSGEWYLYREEGAYRQVDFYGKDSEAAEVVVKALNNLYESRKQDEKVEEFLNTLRTTLKSARSFHLMTHDEMQPDPLHWGNVRLEPSGRSTITIEIEK